MGAGHLHSSRTDSNLRPAGISQLSSSARRTEEKDPHATRKLSGGISKPLIGLNSLKGLATDEQSFGSFTFEVEAELRPIATPPAGN